MPLLDERKTWFCLVIMAFIIGCFLGGAIVAEDYENNKYVKLRSEIISKTGVDITYPTNKTDKCRLNDSWFGGGYEKKQCR